MKKSKILLLIMFLLSNLIYSQAGPGFDDDVVDAPAAPIDGWVYVVLIAGACYGYKKIIINANSKSVNREV